MSLNNLSLPSFLIADLYCDVLVQGTASAMPIKETISFLGKNEKNIGIFVANPQVPFLPDKELTFLTTILSACQLSLADVAIINQSHISEEQTLESIKQLAAKKIILFNVPATVLGASATATPYAINRLMEIPFVTAPALSEIEKDVGAKKLLWNALKQLFGI